GASWRHNGEFPPVRGATIVRNHLPRKAYPPAHSAPPAETPLRSIVPPALRSARPVPAPSAADPLLRKTTTVPIGPGWTADSPLAQSTVFEPACRPSPPLCWRSP